MGDSDEPTRDDLDKILMLIESHLLARKIAAEGPPAPELTLEAFVLLTVGRFRAQITHFETDGPEVTEEDLDWSFVPVALAAVGAGRMADLVRRGEPVASDAEDLAESMRRYARAHRARVPRPADYDREVAAAIGQRFEAWREAEDDRISQGRWDADREPREFLHRAGVGDVADVRAALERNPGLVRARKVGTEETALHLAARRGHVEVVQLLLDRRADVSALAIERHTPLTAALWAVGNPHRGTTDERLHRVADLIRRAGGR